MLSISFVFKVIGGHRHIFACLTYINLQLCIIQELFTELKNIFSFWRYFDYNFWKCKGSTVGSVLQMRFLGNHTKCINSLRNQARKLIFGQNVYSDKVEKVTRVIFDILKIFIIAPIFMSKMAIFHLKMAAIMEIFKISNITHVTFFAL